MKNQKVIITTKLFIINSKGNILVLRRSKTAPRRPLTWDLPGGIVEYGEDPNRAVIRETQEETGLKINTATSFYIASDVDGAYIVRLIYWARSDDKDIKLSYEHDQCKWVGRPVFQKLNIPPIYKEAMRSLPETGLPERTR